MFFKRISVIGMGYIGLPTASMLASKGFDVIGVDYNQEIVSIINNGKIHIVEKDLGDLVKKTVRSGNLRAVSEPEEADAFLIAVPTPFHDSKNLKELPSPDLSYVESACKSISSVIKKGDLIILESTSPVGTTEKIAELLAEIRKDLTFPSDINTKADIKIAYCPERVMPGNILNELVFNDRVIGGLTDDCSDSAIKLYKSFVKGNCIQTNARTAEMVKLTENASRDVNIAFANELSIICDSININVWELIELANLHPRVNILEPGPGVGGHCIAVDPWFIVHKNPSEAKLIHAARKVNDYKPQWVINKVKESISIILKENDEKQVSDINISCFGLTFKPNIDDLRESPALLIAEEISKINDGKTMAVEPNIKELPEILSIPLSLVSIDTAIKDSDIILLLVDHDEFKSIDDIHKKFKGFKIIDTKGIWA